MTRRKEKPFIKIDADEFDAAQRDQAVKDFLREAMEYRQALIENGHCPKCLVVNCECDSG